MLNKNKIVLFFLIALGLPASANMNGVSGASILEFLFMVLALIVLVHVIAVIAYKRRIKWLRIISGILYLPILFGLLKLIESSSFFLILLLGAAAFFYFIIIKEKEKKDIID